MTKQEYLESIGYKYDSFNCNLCREKDKFLMVIDLGIKGFYIDLEGFITSQEDIDNLQMAFNNLKQDYEECMKYE